MFRDFSAVIQFWNDCAIISISIINDYLDEISRIEITLLHFIYKSQYVFENKYSSHFLIKNRESKVHWQKLKKMLQLSIFAICLLSAFTFNLMKCSNAAFDSNIEVNFVQNLTEFLIQNSGIQMKPLDKEVISDGPSSRTQILHTMGHRIAGNLYKSQKLNNFILRSLSWFKFSGDRLLATFGNDGAQWDTPHFVRINLYYPRTGFGGIVTFFRVVCDQVKFN